jgi:hypothetical protein
MCLLNLTLWSFLMNRVSAAPLPNVLLLGAGFSVLALQKLCPRDVFTRCAAVPNDERAWHEFLRRYRPHIVSAIHRILGFPPAGRHCYLFPDVLQRVYLRLLENGRRALHGFRGESEETAQFTLACGDATKFSLRRLSQITIDYSHNI